MSKESSNIEPDPLANPASVCPFCRSSRYGVFEIDCGRWAVSCSACGAIGPAADSEPGAIGRWERGFSSNVERN